MPRGGRRPGAGRKRKPIAALLLSGGFRKDRHGDMAATRAALARGHQTVTAGSGALQLDVDASAEAMPPALTGGLRAVGLAFVAAVWERYTDWSAAKVQILHEAGATVDLLGDLEAALEGHLTVQVRGLEAPNPFLRHQRQARASLTMLIAHLELKET